MPAAAYRPRFRLDISPGFFLLFALVWFFDNGGLVPPLLAAVAVHELGHVAALYAFGARPVRLRASLSGFALDYAGFLTGAQKALAALAGPALGAGFAALCAAVGAQTKSSFWLTCAGIGVVLTVFNLLPVWPLDGGICVEYILRRLTREKTAQIILRALAAAVCAALLGGGLCCLLNGDGPALFFSGVWLVVLRSHRACNRS